jgi:hypothetical protein
MGLFTSKPQRFFRAFSISGQPADLGFECETCHSVIRYGLTYGQHVAHCNINEPVPSDLYDLPCRSLRRGMPEIGKQGFILIDTDATNDGGSWESESDAKSDDPSAFEVGWV